jgi:hypothetical protein
MGIGDLLIALAGARGRAGESGTLVLYWLGIVVIYAAPTAAALRCGRDRRALMTLAVVLIVATYLVTILNSPLSLTVKDELQTYRSLLDLHETHHLFSLNPLVSDYPRFPGSQIVIVVMQQLTRLSLGTSARLIIGLEHLLLAVALFALVERVCGSPVAGFVGVAVYTTNPSYLYVDNLVFYETFALPLAILALLVLATIDDSTTRSDRMVSLGVASVLGIVVCVSHHLTSYFLAGVLIAWCIVAGKAGRRGPASNARLIPWIPAAATALCSMLWYVFMAHAQITQELGPTFDSAVSAIKAVLTGSATPKVPFSASARVPGFVDPFLLEVIGYLSVLLSSIILIAGLWQLRRREVRTVSLVLFGLVGLLYPIGLALRITQASTETSGRSSEFAFLGIAVLAALLVGRLRIVDDTRRPHDPSGGRLHLASRPRRRFNTLSGRPLLLRLRHALGRPLMGARATVAIVVLLACGGVVVGQAPYDRVAGTYIVGDDIRSIEPLGQETAQWATTHWAKGTKFAADPVNTYLIAANGDFTPEQGVIEGIQVSRLFLSNTVDSADETVVEGDKIRYVVVDERLTEMPSASGPAFGGSGKGVKVSASKVVPKVDFAKFNSSSLFSLVYDDGTIRIYETQLASNLG